MERSGADKQIKRQVIYTAVKLVAVLLAILFILLFSPLSLSWFSHNESTGATGLNIAVSSLPGLTVRVTAGGDEVGDYTVAGAVEGEDYKTLPVSYTTAPVMAPGAAGTFVTYLTYSTTSTVTAVTDVRTANTEVDAATEALVVRYANTHILFTYAYDDDGDSATPDLPLTPDAHGNISIPLTAGQETKLTVTWRWILNFTEWKSEGITLTQNSDCFHGIDHSLSITDPANAAAFSTAYNSADTMIALYMSPLYFHIEFA